MTPWPPSRKCDIKSKNLTPSIDVYLLEEQFYQILFRSNLKWRSRRIVVKRSP